MKSIEKEIHKNVGSAYSTVALKCSRAWDVQEIFPAVIREMSGKFVIEIECC